MRKAVYIAGVIAAVFACSDSFDGGRLQAFPAYQMVFNARYVQPGTGMYVALNGKGTCYVCHGGSTKKVLTPYAMAFRKFVTKKDGKSLNAALTAAARAENSERAERAETKINAAFDAVEKVPSDPKDKNSPTFGELIKSGKLPAGA